MDITSLKPDDTVRFVDKYSIARKGTVIENKSVGDTVNLRVKSNLGDIETIKDKKKVVALG